MGENWDAVAAAIQARLLELDLTQTTLAARAGVSAETVRELRTNLHPRRRSPRTMTAVSIALGWSADHLAHVLRDSPASATVPAVPGDLGAVAAELALLADRLATIATRLAEWPVR